MGRVVIERPGEERVRFYGAARASSSAKGEEIDHRSSADLQKIVGVPVTSVNIEECASPKLDAN